MSYKQNCSREPGDIGYNGFLVSLFYLARIDVECITDANLTVIFKNLLKKNAVTREKRMLELLTMLQNDGFDFKDESFIMVWLQLYPRVALDSSKTVRQLAHQIQTTLVEKIGGREFSKYFKTSVPLMLQSLYDDRAIASATYSSLLLEFNNDHERVNEKLWVIFQEQIVNYCRALIVHETPASITDERYESKEDVLLKYDRAVNGAIQMLLKLVTISNKDFCLSKKAIEDFEVIINHDELWDRILTCATTSTLNVPLMKSYMQLLKAIFSLNEGNILPFASHLYDLKGLYKLVSKKLLRLKFLPPESSNSSIIYSGFILQFWDALTCLTIFTDMDAASKKSLKIKKNFWQLGGSKSYSRMKEYLKLGWCQSSPQYYLIIKSFFVGLKAQNIKSDDDFSFLNFSSSKDAKSIVEKILLPQYTLVRGKDAVINRRNCALCICAVMGLFQLKQPASDSLFNAVFYALLDGIAIPCRPNEKRSHEEAIEQLIPIVSNGEELIGAFVSEVGKLPFIIESYEFKSSVGGVFESFLFLLSLLPEHAQLLDSLLNQLMERIVELYEAEEISQAFSALLAVLPITPQNSALLDFASTLPSFISKNFVDLPLKVFEELLVYEVQMDLEEVVEDLFTKLSIEAPSHLNELFVLLNRKNKRLNLSNSDIHQYILSLSTKQQRSELEDQVVFAFLDNPEIASNIFSSSLTDESAQMRLIETLSANQISLHLSPEISLSLKSLVETSLKNIHVVLCQKFLSLVDNSSLLSSLVYAFIVQNDYDYDFVALCKFIALHSDLLSLDDIACEIEQSLGEINLSMLSLANPLYQNIHLVKFPSVSSCKINDRIISIGKFLLDYLTVSKKDNVEVFMMLGLCGQYCEDYAFIVNIDKPKANILTLGSQLSAQYATHASSLDVVVAVMNGTLDYQLVYGKLSATVSGKGPYSPYQYYNARLLVLLFTPVFESLSLSDFDTLDIQYTRLPNDPLKMAVFLCSAMKFVGVSKKLDRIRNYVFGEVLGVKKHDILDSGITWISLAINFLRIDNDNVSQYDVMPAHKWGMFINHINSWLESDIAYDSDFLPIRCLLAIFFTHLIPIVGSKLPERAWPLAIELCVDNLSIAQVEGHDFELMYFSMRLFLVLNRYVPENIVDTWKKTKNSIMEELVELMINEEAGKYHLEVNNQPVILCNELLERILSRESVPTSFVASKIDKFYKLLSRSKFFILQRVVTLMMQKYILKSQQDFVIEYLLTKSNLSEGEDINDILLPAALVSNIQTPSNFEEYVEEEDYSSAVKYLWSWVLVFAHFQDTTYSIKTHYINQIKVDRTIESLLDIIFAVVDVSDANFLKRLVTSPLEKQSKATPEVSLIQDYLVKDGCVGEPVNFEIRFLLVHLYYLSFQYLGSFVQQWFNEIRDLQLKKLVEKFSVRYVSPILISMMLADVESKKNKLTERDENLTIKVNKITNEIKSVYVIDEQTMEMVVKIPETFPLSNVTVEGPVRLGVKENQWKAWLLASQRVISLTNGSIIDCIELFNRNVNLHFSGFEECAICYSILHQDHSLPSKVCPTCLNKFHAACLYKWFKSSGSSTCPLCRCAFNFKART